LSSSARSSACRSLAAASEEDTSPWPPAHGRSEVSVCWHATGARLRTHAARFPCLATPAPPACSANCVHPCSLAFSASRSPAHRHARTAPLRRTPGRVLAHNTNAGARTTGARITSGGVQRSLQLALLRDEELAHFRGQPELLLAFGIAG
jgi:hypothetical protein